MKPERFAKMKFLLQEAGRTTFFRCFRDQEAGRTAFSRAFATKRRGAPPFFNGFRDQEALIHIRIDGFNENLLKPEIDGIKVMRTY